MKLRVIISISIVVSTFYSFAFAGSSGKSIIGMAEERLVLCAGIPSAQMRTGNSTIFQYSDLREAGSLIGTGAGLMYSSRTRGCQAQVVLQDGKVVDVQMKGRGLISGPLTCQKIFSGC